MWCSLQVSRMKVTVSANCCRQHGDTVNPVGNRNVNTLSVEFKRKGVGHSVPEGFCTEFMTHGYNY